MSSTQRSVALVTGSAKRIGAEVVRKLHAEGMNVILHFNGSHELAERIANELNAIRPASLTLIQHNLLNFEQLNEFSQRVLGCYGRLDVLINNASTFYPTPMDEITHEQWDDLIGVNLKAPLFLSHAFALSLIHI